MDSRQGVSVLVSTAFAGLIAPSVIALRPLGGLATAKTPVIDGPLPVGVFLTGEEPISDEFQQLIAQMDIPLHRCCGSDPQGEFTTFLLGAMAERTAQASASAAQERAASASLRQDFMALEQGFAVAERFLYGAMAPEFALAREWGFDTETTDAPALQPLPVGSTALAAVDVWLTKAGQVTFALQRPIGDDFIAPITVAADAPGWVRLLLDAPLAGLAEDMVLSVSATAPLGLSHPSALPHFCVADGRPLALRLWKGIPGARLPDIPARPGGAKPELIPPSHMPTPELVGNGSAELLTNRDALALHPGVDGRLHLVFRGLDWQGAASLAAYVQNHGPEIVQVSLGVAAPDGEPRFRPAMHLSPAVYAQCDVDLTGGPVDLHVKLLSKTPIAHVILWGFERRPVA